MDREVITSPRVTPMRSATSHAVKAGGFVFVTGVTPFRGSDRMAAEIDKGDLEAQIHQVMTNMAAILEEAGSSMDRIVKVSAALTDLSQYARFDAAYRKHFPKGAYPARQTTESARLAHPDFLVSIDCIALAGTE
ncbi:RidA family protein [Muricoccus radiodurans]|uniref:RidA family protein n=1 Tax=Muricoccus radiodurans TaxID=2231721 RepID=UPI003CE7E657